MGRCLFWPFIKSLTCIQQGHLSSLALPDTNLRALSVSSRKSRGGTRQILLSVLAESLKAAATASSLLPSVSDVSEHNVWAGPAPSSDFRKAFPSCAPFVFGASGMAGICISPRCNQAHLNSSSFVSSWGPDLSLIYCPLRMW